MNLPTDRMILIEDIEDENNSVLINVDELESVKRFDSRPQFYIGPDPQPYGRGLKFTFASGESRLVETAMTLREFEIERARKFTPVPEEQPLVAVYPPMDEGWKDTSFKTEWLYYRPLNEDWVKATDMGDAIDMSKLLYSKHKAVVHRTQEKEFTPYGLE